MTEDGVIYAARDRMGRLPVLIGRDAAGEGYCISFESLRLPQARATRTPMSSGSGEIVRVTPEGYETVAPAERAR